MDLTLIAVLGIIGIACGSKPATKHSCAAMTIWFLKH